MRWRCGCRQRARKAAPHAPRPLLLTGQRHLRGDRPAQALAAWDTLRERHPAAFVLVAGDYAGAAVAQGTIADARSALESALAQLPAIEIVQALRRLDATDPNSLPRLLAHLQQHPTLSAALMLLDVPAQQWPPEAWAMLRAALERAARPLQRYRCAACGFEAQHYFWQCPGCLSWDSYPPKRIDAL